MKIYQNSRLRFSKTRARITAFLMVVVILLFGLQCFAQVKPKKQTGKKLQIGVVTTLAASSLTMEKMPAYMPITGAGLFGIGFVLDLKQNKKNPKMKSRKKNDNI